MTSTEAPTDYHGSCLCGAVQYRLSSPPKAVTHCHCSQCRKGHGAAFASYASVPRSSLHISGEPEALNSYASSPGVARQFCGRCGASLFWSNTQGAYADWVSIALGSLDTPFLAPRQKHLYVADKAPWHSITDAWPQHD
ncbi:MAG: GFA family protein [Candidatus Pseudomonas colombiensis]|jgi:hypothetical protein|nr:MAG: GFA family protein [Pseudomonas sp.]